MAEFKEQATVRVWRNVKTLGKVPTSHFGHAAVTIKGAKVNVVGYKNHISFWPGDYASKGNAIFKQTGDFNDELKDDKISEMNQLTALRLEVGYRQANGMYCPPKYIAWLTHFEKTPITSPRPGQKWLDEVDSKGWPLWSQSADEKVALPGTDCGDRLWGLSICHMNDWWENFKNSGPQYQALGRQNCAGVALDALKEGGSEAFLPCPYIKAYTEPTQVEDYAKRLRNKLNEMENLSTQLDDDIKQAVMSNNLWAAPGDPPADGIWELDKWKRESALGTFQVRSSTIRQIDNAVARFHEANWTDQFTKRYTALVQAFLGVVKHREEKADSGRSRAVLRLGAQILAIVRNPKANW